ncbi:MAG: hypothetical protein NVSMB32_12140 [Actinomycetota bacterium]
MSLQELPQTQARFGSYAYLLTVSPDSTPRATSVRVEWSGAKLMVGAGRRSSANIEVNDQVAIMWPPPEPGDYTLIVDGWADVQGPVVFSQPKSAILHVTQRPL